MRRICRKSYCWRHARLLSTVVPERSHLSLLLSLFSIQWFLLFHEIFLVSSAFVWNKLYYSRSNWQVAMSCLITWWRPLKWMCFPSGEGNLTQSWVRSRVQVKQDLSGDSLESGAGRRVLPLCWLTAILLHLSAPARRERAGEGSLWHTGGLLFFWL